MSSLHTPSRTIDPLAVGEREAAKLLSVSQRTLWNWRRLGTGPHYRKVGGRVLYPIAALHSFLNGTDAGDARLQTGGDHE